MSKTIDEKVVSMEFDNSKFEGNVKTTMSTLDKLKQSLNFKGASKGLESIEAASKKLDFSKLEIGATQAGFHVRDVWEKTAQYIENNIAQRIVNAGNRIAKSLTVEPIRTGFNEYELKMDSVRTILNSTGEPLERVNKLLNELNTYSDQTIYSFQDMTQNIGKFTNAGVKLDDAVLAIKGISNEAAVSGANANEASRAMYNFAQALSSGYVKLIDWKSIENANMATVEFKQQLIDSAVACGTLTKTADGMYKTSKRNISATQNFNDSLQDQWMTSEVLIETLKRYSDSSTDIGKKAFAAAQEVTKLTQMWDVLKETAQSGWAQTWELIFGDLNQAKAIFTPLTNFFSSIIEAVSKFRNSILEGALDITSPLKALSDKLFGISEVSEKVADATGTMSGAMKEYGEIVDQVIRGEWGRGQDRWDKLTEAGYDWAKVQNLVNEKLGSNVRHMEKAIEAQKEQEKQTKSLTDAELRKMGSSAAAIKQYREQERRSQSLSDAKLKELGLTEEEIEVYRELEEEYIKTGVSMDKLIEKSSGRELMIETFKNLGQTLVTVFGEVGKAWNDIFNDGKTRDQIIAEKVEQLRNLIEVVHDFSERVLASAKNRSDDFARTFKGLFAAIQLVSNLVGGALKIGFKVITSILGMFDLDILDLTANIGDAIVALNDWVKAHDPLTKVLEKISPYIKKAVTAISEWIKIHQPFTKAIDAIVSGFKEAKDAISGWYNAIKNGKKTPKQVAEEIVETFGYLAGFVSSAIKTLIENVKDGFKKIPEYMNAGLSNGILDGTNFVLKVIVELGKMMLDKLCEVLGIHSPSRETYEIGKNFIAGFFNALKEGAGKLLEIVKSIFTKIIDFVKGLDFGAIFAVAIGTGITVGLYKSFKSIEEALDVLSAPFEGLGNLLNSAADVIKTFSGTLQRLGKAVSFSIRMKAIKELAIAIAILVGSFAVLTLLDSSKFLPALGVIAAMVGMVAALAAVAGNFGPKNVKQFNALSSAIFSISGSIAIVAIALKVLSKADPEGLGRATLALITIIGGLIGLVAIFEKMPKGFGPKKIDAFANTIKSFTSMILKLSFALLIMSIAVKILGTMKPSVLGQGTLAIIAFVEIVALLTLITKIGGKNIDKLGDTLLKMSLAIGIMAIIVKMLGKMKPSVLAKGYLAILGFVGIIALLTLITKIGGKQISEQLGKTLIAMSVAIGILALSIKLLGSMSADQLSKGYVAILGFVAIIAILTLITKIAGATEIAKVGATILAMSTAIGILAIVAIMLSLISIPGLIKGIVAVGILSAFMAGLIIVTKNAQDCKGTIIAMVIAIGVMTACIAALSLIKPTKLAGAAIALGILMGMFALIIKSSSKLKKSVIAPLVVMIGIVAILAGIIYLLSNLPIKNSLSAAVSLGILMLALSGSIIILGKAKSINKSVQKTLLIMLGIVAGLALVIGLLCTFASNLDKSITAAASLSILMLAMSASMVILGKTKKIGNGTLKALGIMTLVTAGLGLVLGLLCTFASNLDKSITAAIGLSILMIAMSASMIILSKAGTIGTTVLTALGVMALVTAGLGLILGLLCTFASNLDKSITAAIGLSILMIAMSASMIILSKAGTIGTTVLTALGVMTLVVAGLALVLGLLCTYSQNLDSAITVAIALGILLVSMSIALALIGALSPLLEAAIVGVPVFGLVVAELAAVLAALGALKQIPGLTWFIDEGGALLCQLSGILGEAIGSFVGGIFEGLSTSLIVVGENLSTFMDKVGGFITGCSGIKEDVVTGAKNLAGAIIAITVADLVNNLASFLSMGSSLAELGSDLSAFMVNAFPFIALSRMVDPAAMEGCKTLAEMLLILTAADMLDGLTSWLTGGVSFADFGDQLVSLGPSIASFANSVNGINTESVKAATDTLKAIIGMANDIPNEGGWAAKLLGDNSLAAFSPQMTTLGKGLKSFALQAKGIVYEDVEGALKAAKAIIGMANDVPNEGGLDAIFAGDNSLAAFSPQMTTLGNGLKSFAFQAKGIIYKDVEGALKAAKAIVDLANDIPSEGGFMAKLLGDNSLASFANQLPDLGSNLKTFSEKVNGINITNIENATKAAGFIVELSKTIPEDKLFKNETTLDEFGDQLSKYGEGLSAYYESVSGIDSNTLNSSIMSTGSLVTLVNRMIDMDTSGITTFKEALSTLSEADITGFIESYGVVAAGLSIDTINKLIDSIRNMVGLNPSGVGTFKAALDALATVSLDDFVAAFDGSASRAATAVSNLMSSLTDAVNIGKTGFTTAFDTMIMTALSTVTNKQSLFLSAGQNVMSMLTTGMTSIGQSGLVSTLDGVMLSLLNTITSKQMAFTVAGNGLMSSFLNGATSGANSSSPASAFDSMILSVIASINGKASLFTTAGRSLVTSFVNGISTTGNTSASSAFNTIIMETLSSITNKQSSFMMVGQTLINAFANGIKDKKSAVKNAVAQIVSASYDTLSEKYSDFESAGSYLVDGFAAGISASTWKAEAQAIAMAQAALEAAKEELGIQSPSKEFYKVGDFAGQGFTNAIKDYEVTASKAGKDMGNSATKGLSDAIAKIKDLFGKDFDSTPTIRPVLDLSNVQNGMGSLSGMFSGMNGFTLSGSVAMAQQTGASMNSRYSSLSFENKMNDEIVKLNESISGLREDMAKQYEASQATPEVNLYMDSRKVASSIAKPMDKELNMLAKRRK